MMENDEEKMKEEREIAWEGKVSFGRFVGAANESSRKHAVWQATQDGLVQVQEEVSKDVSFSKFVNGLMGRDNSFNEMKKTMDEYELVTGDKFKNEIVRIFKVAFKKAKSKNVVVAAARVRTSEVRGASAICIGPPGFSLRRNVQAQPIRNYGEMVEVIERKDEVLASLRSMKMFVVAGRFERFCDCVPALGSERGLSMKLRSQVILPTRFSREPPKSAEKMEILGGREANYITVGDEYFCMSKPGWREMLVYLQLHNDMPEYVKECKERMTPAITRAKSSIEALQKEFGRQLFADAL